MKLIIDMPEEEWLFTKAKIVSEDDSYVDRAIANGIPLPKGHGRLIDADNIKSYFSNKEGDAFTVFHFYDAIKNTPTIIEADKEQTDETDN